MDLVPVRFTIVLRNGLKSVEGFALSATAPLAMHQRIMGRGLKSDPFWQISIRKSGYRMTCRDYSREQATSLLVQLEIAAPWQLLTWKHPKNWFDGWTDEQADAAGIAVARILGEEQTA